MWRGSRKTDPQAPKRETLSRKQPSSRARIARSKIAQRRVKIRVLQAAIGVVLIVSIVGGLSWLSFWGGFAVQSIVVEGNEKVHTRAIESQMMLATAGASLGLFSRQNALLYPSAELESILAFEFPKIGSIAIDTQLTKRQVVVSVEERKPYARWCKDVETQADCYLLDREGFIFEPTTASSTDLVTFFGGVASSRTDVLRASVAPEYFEAVQEFLSDIAVLGLKAQEFSFDGNDAYLRFADGWELRIALDKDLGAAAFNLAAVLDEHDLRERLADIKYVDMRFDTRVYYKLREGADTEE